MKKYLLSLLLFFQLFLAVDAQNGYDELKGKFYLSPDFGLMLGSINRIEFSPALGYHLTNRISLAAGFKYEFYSTTRVYMNQPTVKTSIYGPKVFLKYTLINNFNEFLPIGLDAAVFGHIEYEANSLETADFGNIALTTSKRFWHDTFLIGGGLSQSPSPIFRVNILFLWDTNTGSLVLYNNPIIRFGIQIYLMQKEDYSY